MAAGYDEDGSEGHPWSFAAELLMELDRSLLAVFLVYILPTIFGVLNIIEAPFVESAIASAQHLLLEEKMAEKENYVQQMRSIFNDIVVDQSGAINIGEPTEFLTCEGFSDILRCLT